MRKLSIASSIFIAISLAFASGARANANTAPCTLRCDSTLTDTLTILSEPAVTRGLTNTVRFKFPDLRSDFLDSLSLIAGGNARLFVRVEHDGICDQSSPLDDFDLRTVGSDSIYSVTVNRFNGQPLRSGETYGYSLGLEVFTCPTGDCPDGRNLKILCLPFTMKRAFSTQDDQPPTTEIESEFTANTCLTDSALNIPFGAWDEISGGIDLARLWIRNAAGVEWQAQSPLEQLISGSSSETAGMASYPFTRLQDGYHEFLVTARDTARHPEWSPENPVPAGNEPPPPDSSTRAQASLFIDAKVPWSQIGAVADVQDLLCFDIPYRADDPRRDDYESGLVSITLNVSRNDSPFEVVASHNFGADTSNVDSVFSFKAPGDGTYRFYTLAADSCGNVQQLDPNLFVTTEVQATPQIVRVSPDTTEFHTAAEVGPVVVEFDRLVVVDDSTCILRVTNLYNKDEEIPGTCTTDNTDVTTLTWNPDSPLTTSGLFKVTVDLSNVQTSDSSCGLQGQSLDFQFFTFMEPQKGGSIRTAGCQIDVPSGAPSEQLVIVQAQPQAGSCLYDRANTITGSERNFSAFKSPGLEIDIPVPATLSISYKNHSIDGDPRALRIFELLPGGCFPAGDKQSWRVSTQEMLVFTTVEDVTSEFNLVSLDAASDASEAAVANYPNPFGNGSDATKITYTVSDPAASLSLRIYDQFGNLVKAFRPDQLTRHFGLNECPWDGRNDLDELVASGGYLCVFENGGKKHIRKIAVLR